MLNKINYKTLSIIITFILLVKTDVFATVYQTVQNGNWNSHNTWSPSKPSMNNNFTDTIYISHNVSLSDDLNVYGNFQINAAGKLYSNSKELKIQKNTILINNGIIEIEKIENSGSIINFGSIEVSEKFKNKKSYSIVNNSGSFTIEGDVENKGIIENSGTLSIEDDLENQGLLSNTGIVSIEGDLDNDNQIVNSGNIYVDSSISGNGDITGVGSICNSDGTTDPTGGAKANNITCDICNASSTLPVQLISFEAEAINAKKVTIKWSTATEENNDYFEILRSVDGSNFEVIATIDGNGNSNAMLYYQIDDNTAENGVNYYQLKQVDFDGKATLSNTIFVNISNLNEVTVYPNPVQSGSDVTLNFGLTVNAQVEIYDMSGRLLNSVITNDSQVNIPTSQMQKGMYIIKVIEGEKIVVKRFLVN